MSAFDRTIEEAFNPLFINVPSDINYDSAWINNMLTMRAIQGKGTVYSFSDDGYPTVSAEEFIKEFEALGGREIGQGDSTYRSCNPGSDKVQMKENFRRTYLFSDGYISINIGESCSVHANSLDKSLIEKVEEISLRVITKSARKDGKAYVLVRKTNGEIDLSSIGVAAIEFKESNYTKDVVEGYRHVVKDLSSPTPCGRISIFDGIPGTGKTFLIRALLKDVTNALFIIVTPDMIPELSSPSMVKVLIDHKEDLGPTVFLVEDADTALAKRSGDNMSSVSAVLNLSDGLLGNMLDIRLVTTTNAVRSDIDEAVMRDGRLCRRIEVPPLSYKEAVIALKELGGDSSVLGEYIHGREYTLGQLYRLARNDRTDGSKEITRKGIVGFA